MKKYLVTGLVLALFSLACGLLLSIVNELTKGPIEKQVEKALNESIAVVLGDNPDFLDKTKTTKSTDSSIKSTYFATLDGEEYVIYVIDEKGFASTIKMMIAVDEEGAIKGYSVVSSAETKGDIKSYSSKNGFNMNDKTSTEDFIKLSGSSVSSNAVKKAFEVAISAANLDLGGN